MVLSEEVEEETRLVLTVRLPEGALGSLQRSTGTELRLEVIEPAAEPYLRGA